MTEHAFEDARDPETGQVDGTRVQALKEEAEARAMLAQAEMLERQAQAAEGTLTVPNRLIPSPAIRLYLFGVCGAVGALLVYLGVIEQGALGLIVAVAGAVLGVSNIVAAANVPRK